MQVFCRGSGYRFTETLRDVIDAGCRGIISFGIAGGLVRQLRPGAWVVASSVVVGKERLPTDPVWSQMMMQAHQGAMYGPLAGSDVIVMDPPAKRKLHIETSALAVDMESHVAARLAAERGLPFAAFRVVADHARRRLPAAALDATLPDGTADIRKVLRSVARDPIQIPHLIGTALDTRKARNALASSRRLLGNAFGLPDELPEVIRLIAAE